MQSVKKGRYTALVKSMTGYGRGDVSSEKYRIIAEMKSVNHRFLEVSTRLPRQLNGLDDQVKRLIQQRISRGKIDVYISMEQISSLGSVVNVDSELALLYCNGLREAAKLCDINQNIALSTLVALPGIVTLTKADDDLEELTVLVNDSVEQALSAFVAMRQREGEGLAIDLSKRIAGLKSMFEKVSVEAPIIVDEYRIALQTRIIEMLGAIEVDPARLAAEVAFYADKSDITEELIRLKSHFEQFGNILDASDTVGRKLEFLVQEINREVNTIGSKSNSLLISRIVIDAKSELEKIREQIQNIE